MYNYRSYHRTGSGPYPFHKVSPRSAVTGDLSNRVNSMSQEHIRMALLTILFRNERARLQFDALSFTPPSSLPEPANPVAAQGQQRIGEEVEGNEFENTVRKMERSIQRQSNVEEPDRGKASRLEDTVEKAIKSIGAGCATTIIEESDPDDAGGYYITEITREIKYSTRRDGLRALLSMANTILDAKDGVITGTLNPYTIFLIARGMEHIVTPLKPHEKEQLRRDHFMEMLEALTERVDWDSRTHLEQVAGIILG